MLKRAARLAIATRNRAAPCKTIQHRPFLPSRSFSSKLDELEEIRHNLEQWENITWKDQGFVRGIESGSFRRAWLYKLIGGDPSTADIEGRPPFHNLLKPACKKILGQYKLQNVIPLVDINAQDSYGNTALHRLAELVNTGQVEDPGAFRVAMLLLYHQADPFICNDTGVSAQEAFHKPIFHFLLEEACGIEIIINYKKVSDTSYYPSIKLGVSLFPPVRLSPFLTMGTEESNFRNVVTRKEIAYPPAYKTLQRVLDSNNQLINVNAKDLNGNTALHLVANLLTHERVDGGAFEVIKLLLSHKADLSIENNNGISAEEAITAAGYYKRIPIEETLEDALSSIS